jgi:hypothetical protein
MRFQVLGSNVAKIRMQIPLGGSYTAAPCHLLYDTQTGTAVGCVGYKGAAVFVGRDCTTDDLHAQLGHDLPKTLPSESFAGIAL